MAEPKTRKTAASVKDFIAAVENEQRRKDAPAIAKMMAEVTGQEAAMWGPSIVGFGSYRGPTGEWPVAAFSPRKANLVLYITPSFPGREALLKKLGPHRTGTGCLYLNRLDLIDLAVLREIVERSVAATTERAAGCA